MLTLNSGFRVWRTDFRAVLRRFYIGFALAFCAGVLLQAFPLKAQAQEQTQARYVSLVADEMRLIGRTGVEANGNVEIFYDGTRLQAEKLTWDKSTGLLIIEGPLRLSRGDQLLILADAAELSDDLRNGIIRSARLVLDQQLQIAAREINMVEGRYTRLTRATASSCHSCAGDPVPLWQIRARSIVHDREEQQLYFTGAQLLIRNIPVFYLPRLRLPDPTLERATGFLLPRFRSNSRLGAGLKMPYFIRMGDHRDLTVTPWLSSRTTTLELRYRQAFRTGDIELNGAWSNDDQLSSDRWYLFGEGRFELPRDYRLDFDIEMTSDRAYLLDYGYSDKDRLDSRIAISRARRDKFISAEFVHFNSLRDSEQNATQPTLVTNFLLHRRIEPALTGGSLDWQFEGHSHYRSSETPGNDGRDVARLSARADWRRDRTFANGMVLAALGGVDLDYYALQDQAPGEDDGFFAAGTVGAELRWPLIKHQRTSGVTQLLEPVIQVFYSDETTRGIPNEDSILLEFDEGNLFSDSRFTGADARERGFRSNIGLSWTRIDPTGWSLAITAGRIYRNKDYGEFTDGSGLTGKSSDWLLSGQLRLRNGLTLSNRALFDDRIDFSRNETRVGWQGEKVALNSSYLWIEAAPAENRPHTSEWSFDGSYLFNDRWTGRADWRYDFINDRAARIGLGLEYRNECVLVDFSVARRFTSSISVKPITDYGITVSLSGFGVNTGSRALARRCNG